MNNLFRSIFMHLTLLVVAMSGQASAVFEGTQGMQSYKHKSGAHRASHAHKSRYHHQYAQNQCKGDTVNQEPEANFSLTSNSLYVVAQTDFSGNVNNKTWMNVGGSLIEAGKSLYVYADTKKSTLIESVNVDQSESEFSPLLAFTSVSFLELSPGVHFDEVMVRACKDRFCKHEYKGSPQTVKVTISVAPDENLDTSCPHQEGAIFIDCVDPTWLGATGWDLQKGDGGIDYHYFNGENEFLIQWAEVATGEAGYDTVLDVQFSDIAANGTFRFHPVGRFQSPKQTIDLTEYANGTIEFDVRPLSWGDNTTGLFVTTECGWPCTSGEIPLGQPDLNQWTHFKLLVSDILKNAPDEGLDLSKIEIGFSIFPGWDDMSGVHFQLDNVLWTKGD